MTSGPSADLLTEEAFAHHQEGRLQEAERLYRVALEKDTDHFQALQLLGTLELRRERMDEAIALLERALVILKQSGSEVPPHASLYNNLGLALHASGRFAEAVEHFRQGLVLDPDLTELHVSLGQAWMEQGDFAAATGCYETALRLNPNLPECWCALGTAQARSGCLEDAIVSYCRELSLDPSHWKARFNLAQMLRRTGRHAEAIALLTLLLEESPDDLRIHRQLGIVYADSNRLDLSLNHFRHLLAERPDDAEALQYIADIQQAMGKIGEAEQYYRRSLELRPLITIDAIKSPPDFRALLLFTPGAVNTPLASMVERVEYESNLLNVLPGAVYDLDMLRRRTDVVVNLIADVDQGHAVLPLAAELTERMGKPTVNHPCKIMLTDRESIANLLSVIPDCCVPTTRRYSGATMRAAGFNLAQTPFLFPVLVRPAGAHGGIDFAKVENKTELDAFVALRPDASYYLTRYVDYRSADGFFRKYRFIFVNDAIYPYHLAIDDKWKIHHITTNMAHHSWMQQEEECFLKNPHSVFGHRQYEALQAIQQSVGLEYFGIDCALDSEGKVVVFEVNACMLVHQRNEQFPYKTEPVRRIRQAFDAMLKRMAS